MGHNSETNLEFTLDEIIELLKEILQILAKIENKEIRRS